VIAHAEIVVDDVTYRPVTEPAETRIVILQRGWVMVGRWSRDGDDCTLTDAKVIRRFGTTKGLGELACGPVSQTKVDAAGTVRFHILTMVASIDCALGSWL